MTDGDENPKADLLLAISRSEISIQAFGPWSYWRLGKIPPATAGSKSGRSNVAGSNCCILRTLASLARTFTPNQIEALVNELGEDKVLELTVLVGEIGKSQLKKTPNDEK